jgi:hypothetical protein
MNLPEELLSLVDKTEHNLKIAEDFSGDFSIPILNEWRYGSRHIVNAMSGDISDREIEKSLSHWRRAYYDSCDIVLNCQLEQLAQYNKYWKGYADIVQGLFSEYSGYLERIQSAQETHRNARSQNGERRKAAYEELPQTIEDISKILKDIIAKHPIIDSAIRRAKAKHWGVIITSSAAALGLLIPFGSFLLRLLPQSP